MSSIQSQYYSALYTSTTTLEPIHVYRCNNITAVISFQQIFDNDNIQCSEDVFLRWNSTIITIETSTGELVQEHFTATSGNCNDDSMVCVASYMMPFNEEEYVMQFSVTDNLGNIKNFNPLVIGNSCLQ